ncbi:MAG: RNA polymerase factor sigma-54 [Candidatus Parabeggiatoa sp. nov. 1]|nr:MAG: RNA polymerase factor sigma-54 [Gammaproteobacteria bacterium]
MKVSRTVLKTSLYWKLYRLSLTRCDYQDLDFPKEDESNKEKELSENDDSLSDFDEDSNEIALDTFTDIPKELAVDSEWEDIYGSTLTSSDYPNSEVNGKDFLANQESAAETLQDHLRWQLELTPFNDLDRACAFTIIDAINSDGYLNASLEEIAQSLGGNRRVSANEIKTVLRRIQQFDPLGVGARNLSECLLLQLEYLPPNTPWLKEAKFLVRKYLRLLGTHDYAQLTKRMTLNRDELREVINLIQSLNPRPGASYESSQTTTYVIADVFVKKPGGRWKVELNPEILPKLRINTHYANLMSHISNRDEYNSLKNHLTEARWFIKSLKSRQETLLKVAQCVVRRQTGFLEYGEEAMKPLVLHDIANELEMHESTVSRVTTQKYLHTPRGIFELKYFFSSHVSTSNGGEFSTTAIRAMIKKLIAVENTAKPLSDSQIADFLSDRGIQVARRTVAKYREAMVIPPSNERKRLA